MKLMGWASFGTLGNENLDEKKRKKKQNRLIKETNKKKKKQVGKKDQLLFQLQKVCLSFFFYKHAHTHTYKVDSE